MFSFVILDIVFKIFSISLRNPSKPNFRLEIKTFEREMSGGGRKKWHLDLLGKVNLLSNDFLRRKLKEWRLSIIIIIFLLKYVK